MSNAGSGLCVAEIVLDVALSAAAATATVDTAVLTVVVEDEGPVDVEAAFLLPAVREEGAGVAAAVLTGDVWFFACWKLNSRFCCCMRKISAWRFRTGVGIAPRPADDEGFDGDDDADGVLCPFCRGGQGCVPRNVLLPLLEPRIASMPEGWVVVRLGTDCVKIGSLGPDTDPLSALDGLTIPSCSSTCRSSSSSQDPSESTAGSSDGFVAACAADGPASSEGGIAIGSMDTWTGCCGSWPGICTARS